MFGDLLGGLIDKEAITRETINTTLKDLSEEYECSVDEIILMITPTKGKDEFTCWVYKKEANPSGVLVPMLKREIKLAEILGIDSNKKT